MINQYSNNPNASLVNDSLDLNVPSETIRRWVKAKNIKHF